MDAPEVTAEVHLSNGLPAFNIVGLPDTAVKESKERVRSAIINSRFEFPNRRITINLAPADLPKDGGRFDLPIAIGILAATGQVPREQLDQSEFLGELALSGALRPVTGALTASLGARKAGRMLFLPDQNKTEAALPKAVRVYTARHLLAIIAHLKGTTLLEEEAPTEPCDTAHQCPDMSDVKGHALARRALEVSAAGKHNLLMAGPPGSGKSMLAARLPGILPPMTEGECLEVAAISSIANHPQSKDWARRPIRSPHHTASSTALAGGGSNPKPGEISLAHNGILFLDELPEFGRKSLEVLREPLETGEIAISRATRQVKYPANFQLITAMNPCPCGDPDKAPQGCNNPVQCCNKYQSRLSGPLLDRIDIHIQVPVIPLKELQTRNRPIPEASPIIRQRVTNARNIQLERSGNPNHDISPTEIDSICKLGSTQQLFLERAVEKLGLSTRAYHRILKVARTLADLEQAKTIDNNHLSEAISYRSVFQGNLY